MATMAVAASFSSSSQRSARPRSAAAATPTGGGGSKARSKSADVAAKTAKRASSAGATGRRHASSKSSANAAAEGAAPSAEGAQQQHSVSKAKMVVNLIKKFTHHSGGGNSGSGGASSSTHSSSGGQSSGKKNSSRLDHELGRLNSKIDGLLDKLDDVEQEAAKNPDEQCVVCATNRATMQTFPCAHQAVCRTCFVRMIQAAVAAKKLPLRCVLCRAKILRLQQNHSNRVPRSARVVAGFDKPRPSRTTSSSTTLPQSVSNFSVQDSMAASASNYSFASGVSSVSSATSASSSASSVKSFNFDSLSGFQGGNLISTSQLNRTMSGGSFRRRGSGRTNRCETPRMTKRLTSSSSGAGGDSSASSEASSLLTSPAGSSSSSAMSTSPKSSPEGNSNSGSFPAFAQSPPDSSPRGRSNSGNLDVGNDNDETRGIGIGPPLKEATVASRTSTPRQPRRQQQQQQPLQKDAEHANSQQTAPANNAIRPPSRVLGTPLSPIKESNRESSPAVPGPPPATSDSGRRRRAWRRCASLSPSRTRLCSPVNSEDNEDDADIDEKGAHIVKPSSRIRCADKILNQLEIHAKAEIYFGGTENGGFEQNGQIRSILQRTSGCLDTNANNRGILSPVVLRSNRGRRGRQPHRRNASSWSSGCDDSAIEALFKAIGANQDYAADEAAVERRRKKDPSKRKSVTFADCQEVLKMSE